MKAKKIALLFLAALASISVQAQEIKEITVEKPGKFMKQVKKELASITKLKVTGAMTCEDYTVLTQMPNLQYLDLREAKFDPNKALSSSCSDYLCLHGTLANLEEIHMPTTGFKGIQELDAPKLHKIFIPFEFEIEDVISHNILRKNVSTHSVYVENIPESFGPDLLKNAISKLDPSFEDLSNAQLMTVIKEMPSNVKRGLLKSTGTISYEELDSVIVDIPGLTDPVVQTLFDVLGSDVVYFPGKQLTAVNKWRHPLTNEIISTFDIFGEQPFEGNKTVDNVTSIVLSDKVTTIPERCFSGFSNLKEIKFGKGLKNIGPYAFSGTSIETIDIPEDMILDEKALFGCNSLSELKLHTPNVPEWLRFIEDVKFEGDLYVPDGSYANYEKWRSDRAYGKSREFLDKLVIHDRKAGGSYTITVPKGGTILSYIPHDKLMTADSLTISGVLYEVDFEFIKKASRLTYLDISNCYTTYSEEALKEEAQRRQGMAALFGAISDGLDAEYQDEKIGTLEYKANKYIADEIAKAYSEGISNNDMCLIPHEALTGMRNLKTLKLPILVTMIGPDAFSSCKALEEVTLPPFLKRIGKEAFSYCHSLENVEIPKTVNWIQEKAFYNCNSFTKFVFPEVKDKEEFSFEDDILGACVSLEEIVYPEGLEDIPSTGYRCYSLKRVYFPSTAKTVDLKPRSWIDTWSEAKEEEQCEFHFKSQTPPILKRNGDYLGKKAIICIPKGTITNYMARYGEGVSEYKEE